MHLCVFKDWHSVCNPEDTQQIFLEDTTIMSAHDFAILFVTQEMGIRAEKWIVLFHYLLNHPWCSYPIILLNDRTVNRWNYRNYFVYMQEKMLPLYQEVATMVSP